MEQRTGVKGDQPVKGVVGDSTIETGAEKSKVTERTRAVQSAPNSTAPQECYNTLLFEAWGSRSKSG